MTAGSAGGEIDLPELWPFRGALVGAVELVPVAPRGVGRIEEGDVLGNGDLELADAIAVVDAADLLAGRLFFGGHDFGARSVDRVGEGDDANRGVARSSDLDSLE